MKTVGEEYVSRQEFINMMMAMRSDLAAINARLDNMPKADGDKTFIKVQQIPLEPKQHVMEEVFEIRFDFDKSNIKPEYQDLIRQLASATQEDKNIKVSVVGHTDTAGTKDYNYALGGRRAEAVQKMLIEYGIPASQIVAVSAGEEDLAVPTPNNTPNAENRRVRVVKEVHYTEEPVNSPMAIEVQEVEIGACGEYGCEQ
jgi:outer membrane protein OmpA-like peptidoglycan-associated protein